MSEKSAAQQPPDTGHDYDGIREYDHPLPNWWLATLWLSIVFAFGYWTWFHILKVGPLPAEEYQAELRRADELRQANALARGAVTDDVLLARVKDADVMRDGGVVFSQFCAACHGQKGEGLIGPNLTDRYFLHGARPTEILKVVNDGVTSAGMPAWADSLGAAKAEAVAAYVLAMVGQDLPGKEPQGEPVKD